MRIGSHVMRRWAGAVCAAFAAAAFAMPVGAERAAAGEEIVVFAAASLKNALDDVAAAWTKETGHIARVSLAGSSQLAKQIQLGAPADVFISANVKWMDVLQDASLIDATSRVALLRNRIVLIAHGRAAGPVVIEDGFDLAGLVGDGKLAMAMVDAVPAGIYGKAALMSLRAWDDVAAKVAQADNVRAALALVALGEAPYGIVYATDAAASDNVTVVGVFPEASHPPIIYPAAVTAESKKGTAARSFLAFLASEKAQPMFARQGFSVVTPQLAN